MARTDIANDSYWQELFHKLDQMSYEEFQQLLIELDDIPEVFIIDNDTNE